MSPVTVSVGVFAYNEEATIASCLDAILDQRIAGRIVEVAVVSSGSTDATDAIVSRVASRDPRVRALPQPSRAGKAHAINHYLAHAKSAELVVLVSGDVVLAPGALAAMLAPFDDPTVGMTGARPVPQNERRGVGRLVHLLWQLHHEVARRAPKLGEAIAARAPVMPVPEWTCADEAALEADVTQRRGLRLAYCPDAVAYNRGPERFADWIAHRRRIARAHSEIEAIGYRPATRDPVAIARSAAAHVVAHPSDLPLLALAAVIEALAWIDGRRSAHAPTGGVWTPIESAKRPVVRDAHPPAP